ncbi:hypothetical protein L6164_019814 [Bauhinia variegata]|uniref:Uncharacterized protein n=1 Tax=Bauhinia variegata TaxID=167791 RepID=A0ACB9MUD8_BAUVA|nr:hypothetical protein L6164_019814 [Bauhinia variegata]
MEGLQALSQPVFVQFEPDTEKIKGNLIQKGVYATPKIIHTLRKKEIQKHNRKLKRLAEPAKQPPPLTLSQKQSLSEEYHFRTLKNEYKEFTKAIDATGDKTALMVGKPWEGLKGFELLQIVSSNKEYGGEKLKRQSLKELREMFEERKRDELQWLLEDDIEIDEHRFDGENNLDVAKKRRKRSEAEVIRFLVDRLSAREITLRDWRFSRIMKLSGLPFTEGQLLKIVDELGVKRSWKQALSVVEWVYNDKDHRHYKSRFVYTKLLAVLGKARRPKEALQIFNSMREDFHTYPDMAAYHSIAVTLGQSGLLKELLIIIECMRQKPKLVRKMHKNWDPIVEPDLVTYNAMLNACVPSKQWKGVSWVFKELRKAGLKPNGATYGLAMEVMLRSGKYDLVHELFKKMRRSGETPKALTYKVLVRTFWEEGKVNEAVEAVRDMERRGVIGTGSVYYELACCLCNHGRWQDAMLEVEKIKRLPHVRPLEFTFTGMIMSSMDGGHINACVHIIKQMKDHCVPNVGVINVMLKVYGRNDMFSEAKELFEEIKGVKSDYYTSLEGGGSTIPDEYTYSSILGVCASALQWEYFEHVYREMTLTGYQLDQSKHASLLVEASRAGKWYLLEHAFDMILEAGDIPHPLYFLELVIQAIAQNNYERAVFLVNTMAYAPFQVSEKQWTELFMENEERIGHENLEHLLDALGNCDVVSEATVSNLSRSLHFLCGSGTSRNISSTITFGSENPVRGQNEGSDERRSTIMPNNLGEMMDEGSEFGKDFLFQNDNVKSDTFPVNHDYDKEGDDTDDVIVCNSTPNCDGLKDSRTSLCSNTQELGDADDLAFDEPPSSLDEELWDMMDVSSKDVDEEAPRKPSANEILESWKERRKEDRSYLNSQIGFR